MDKDGGTFDFSTQLFINNVAPTAELTNNGPIVESGSAQPSSFRLSPMYLLSIGSKVCVS